ncbi:hypothetical protein RSW84_28330, partial [Escherichia coli]|uniref:hypothetical protein n=1 Tax=Escherichia coli TaxID=562 RepID=UPI0028DE13BA
NALIYCQKIVYKSVSFGKDGLNPAFNAPRIYYFFASFFNSKGLLEHLPLALRQAIAQFTAYLARMVPEGAPDVAGVLVGAAG